MPEQQWYTHPLFSVALGGILPFGAVCIELFFIMSALWLHQIYYVFVSSAGQGREPRHGWWSSAPMYVTTQTHAHSTNQQGFLMCVFFILMATCAEITIVMIYFQVRAGFLG